MFDWLAHEISEIKTPRFHLVDGPADRKLQEAVASSAFPLPPSYRKFVLQFGNARLYRVPRNDSYRIGVFAGPRENSLSDGSKCYQIGFHDGARVLVRPLLGCSECPVLEQESGIPEVVATSFEEWLRTSCAYARKKFSREQWEDILKGPEPFSPEEDSIVRARRSISWRKIGVDPKGNQILEITNASNRILPAITLGVRSRDGRLNGGVLLKIGHIKPGQTSLLSIECYKDLISPEEIELFSLSDPKPEDREMYDELGGPEAASSGS